MFNSITSFFLILTLGSLPGQLLVLLIVSWPRKHWSRLKLKFKKYTLLLSSVLALAPLFYLLLKRLLLSSASLSASTFSYAHSYPLIDGSRTFLRNSWLMPLAVFWFCGVIYNLLRARRHLLDFRDKVLLEGKMIQAAELELEQAELPGQVLRLLARLTIIKHPAAQSPLVFGYRKKFLVIPDQSFSKAQLQLVLHHEMTHLLHKDLWAKLLLEVIRLMFFYNPVFRQAAVQLDEVCEQLCDQVVTAGLTPAAKKDYGHLLLSMLEQAGPANKMTQAALAQDKNQLKIRLEAIVRPARPSSRQHVLAVLATVVILLLSLLAMIKIIPEANRWDQERQLLAEINYPGLVQATSAAPEATYPPPVQGTAFIFEDEQYIFD